MPKAVVTQYQPSMTEWFAAIGEVAESEAFRQEDNNKADRLEILYQTIGLPYERPEKFSARELVGMAPAFAKLLKEQGSKLCAIRLVPTKPGLPKLRHRGWTLKECYETWFLKQKINPDDYIAYVCPHSETLLWSVTLVINEQAIFGEIIRGLHSQLTHGDTEHTSWQWRFNFQAWEWSKKNKEAQAVVEDFLKLLHVSNFKKRRVLEQQLNTTFVRDYIAGYFEAVVWPSG